MSDEEIELQVDEGQRRYQNDPLYAAVVDAYGVLDPVQAADEEADRVHREECEREGFICGHFQFSENERHRKQFHRDGSICQHNDEEIEELAPRRWTLLIVGTDDDTIGLYLEGDFEKEADELRAYADAGYRIIGIAFVVETGSPMPAKRLRIAAAPHPRDPDANFAELVRRARSALVQRGSG